MQHKRIGLERIFSKWGRLVDSHRAAGTHRPRPRRTGPLLLQAPHVGPHHQQETQLAVLRLGQQSPHGPESVQTRLRQKTPDRAGGKRQRTQVKTAGQVLNSRVQPLGRGVVSLEPVDDHHVQSLLQEMLPEGLGHLGQRIHWKRTNRPVTTASLCTYPTGLCVRTLTGVASLAVDAFFRNAANSPIPVHEEAVTEWVAQPLHRRRHTAAGRQARLAGAAQEHALTE
ncbi:hypothetical protein EYF80_023591 [Liparis tanakae]|uniref:Uncharacterized protein n=1 Tax=Liparis tanakae TaxID=230148 RepID=A0A4Z2HMA4_9TELE|nr:hypothetical protein EYF80_023591 [Liparis tanakae]